MKWWHRWRDEPPEPDPEMPSLPLRPLDVFITKGDTGERIPCELSYSGLGDPDEDLDGDRMHMWSVLTPCRPGLDTISIGYMPSHSSISFCIDGEPGCLGDFDIEINGLDIPFSEDL